MMNNRPFSQHGYQLITAGEAAGNIININSDSAPFQWLKKS